MALGVLDDFTGTPIFRGISLFFENSEFRVAKSAAYLIRPIRFWRVDLLIRTHTVLGFFQKFFWIKNFFSLQTNFHFDACAARTAKCRAQPPFEIKHTHCPYGARLAYLDLSGFRGRVLASAGKRGDHQH